MFLSKEIFRHEWKKTIWNFIILHFFKTAKTRQFYYWEVIGNGEPRNTKKKSITNSHTKSFTLCHRTQITFQLRCSDGSQHRHNPKSIQKNVYQFPYSSIFFQCKEIFQTLFEDAQLKGYNGKIVFIHIFMIAAQLDIFCSQNIFC